VLVQGLLTGLALPPLLLVLLALASGLSTWRGGARGGAVAALSMVGLFALATPLGSRALTVALEQQIDERAVGLAMPTAIIVLGGDMARGAEGDDIGPLTLERLRAAAALHRRTGLPLLVTGGSLAPDAPPIATLMAASLTADFGVTARWVEPHARDTRENAAFATRSLREEGMGAAFVVSHAWHLPRAQAAFARHGFRTLPAPVRRDRPPQGEVADWIPRPDHLVQSWYILREWAGLLVYRLRDGGSAAGNG